MSASSQGRPSKVIRQLSAARADAKVSQREIARRIGTQQSAISEMETGLHQPNLDTLTAYADCFDMEIVAVPKGWLSSLLTNTPRRTS